MAMRRKGLTVEPRHQTFDAGCARRDPDAVGAAGQFARRAFAQSFKTRAIAA
jgi:hypothetical protein